MRRIQEFTLRRLVTLLVLLVLAIPAAYAVTKTLTLVDGSGKPVPKGTQVTIIYPDGVTRDTDETDDDKGTFYYNFPDDGDYQLVYAGGTLTVNVAAGGGGLTAGQWVGAGLATATVIGVAVVAGDSGTKSSGSSSDSGSSGGSGGGSSLPSIDPTVCNATTWTVTTSLSGSDPGNHAPADTFDGTWQVSCPGGAGTTQAEVRNQTGSGPDPQWSCNIDSSGFCFGNDTPCVWGGMTTTCTLDTQFSASDPEWSGVAIIGFDGSLPPGQPVFFDFVGIRQ